LSLLAWVALVEFVIHTVPPLFALTLATAGVLALGRGWRRVVVKRHDRRG
jgi:hypothetical protein